MPPRIAIPMPHSLDREYSERAMPQYEQAVARAGAEPVRIGFDRSGNEISAIIGRCDAVLLPGSNADVDPAKFGADRSPHTANADLRRDQIDVLLLQDAFNSRKPVLGICYGLQSLNVFLRGSLVQHIPDFLPESLRARVDHEAGRKVAVAHDVEIEAASRLAQIVGNGSAGRQGERLRLPVNSSHHQSANAIGGGLRISARCPDDGIIEALEGSDPGHFVLAVQWHPERSVAEDEASRSIFRALVQAANQPR